MSGQSYKIINARYDYFQRFKLFPNIESSGFCCSSSTFLKRLYGTPYSFPYLWFMIQSLLEFISEKCIQPVNFSHTSNMFAVIIVFVLFSISFSSRFIVRVSPVLLWYSASIASFYLHSGVTYLSLSSLFPHLLFGYVNIRSFPPILNALAYSYFCVYS